MIPRSHQESPHHDALAGVGLPAYPPFPPEMLVSGTSEHQAIHAFAGEIAVGVYQAAPARLILTDYPKDELMYVLSGKVTVTEADARRFYETQLAKEGGSRIHLKFLGMLFPAGATQAQKDELQKKAEAVLVEAQKGASLEELAKKFDFPIKDLGFINEGDLDPKLAQFLRTLKPKEVGPIQTPEGFQHQ